MEKKESDSLHVLVMGKSGSGKSTFINNCFNLADNRKFDGDRLFAIPASFINGKGHSKEFDCSIERFKRFVGNEAVAVGESVTKTVNFYDLNYDHFELTLIDTPGLGDTDGVRQDRANLSLIIDAINPIAQIHAIVWVCKGTENRLSQELKYCIEQFKALVPKSHQFNIFVVFTHVGHQQMFNAQQIMSELSMPMDHLFVFENSCIIPIDIFKTFANENENHEEFESEKKSMEKLWRKNEQSFSKLIKALQNIKPIMSDDIKILHFKKLVLKKLLFIYADEVANYELLIKEDNSLQSSKEVQPDTKKSRSLKEKLSSGWNKIKNIFPNSKKKKAQVPSQDLQNNQPRDKEHEIQKQKNLTTKLNHLRASIGYLERHINKVSQVDFFKTLNASNMIENEIFYMEKLKDIFEEERKKKLDGLNKLRSEFDRAKRVLENFEGQETSEMFVVLIDYLSELIKIEENMDDQRKSQVQEVLIKMMKEQVELFKQENFEKASSQFDINFDQFIREAYLVRNS